MKSPATRRALVVVLVVAVLLRAALIVFSPVPFGYVWDFYYEGVQHLARTARLPQATDCWQCYHPPLFYILGWPCYALGRWIGRTDNAGLRSLSALATVASAIAIYYAYRLLVLFRCRGLTLVIGFALAVSFPCLFISSYGAEADIILTAVLSAFLYYLVRDAHRAPSVSRGVRLGAVAGIAAATKYSGLIGVVTGVVVLSAEAASTRADVRARVVQILAMVLACAFVGGWKYVDNYRRYGTPLYANGSAAQGFTMTRRVGGAPYEFFSFDLRELLRMTSRRPPRGTLTDLPIYRSVPTTLHALAWTDMTFFSDPTRHGDPSRPYPPKWIPPALTRAVLILALVPEVLAAIGIVRTMRRRSFRAIGIMCIVSVGAYVWWFTSQAQWGLKTKYLLFLLPAFVLYVLAGLAWLWRHAPAAGKAAGILLVALIVAAHLYLFAFALGTPPLG